MTATKVGPNAQHGIATAQHTGCRCDSCCEAILMKGRRIRHERHRKRRPQPGWKSCVLCGCYFHPKGLGSHELRCQG